MDFKLFKISNLVFSLIVLCTVLNTGLKVCAQEMSEKPTEEYLSRGWEEVNAPPIDPTLGEVSKKMFYSLAMVLVLLVIGAFIFKYCYHGKMGVASKDSVRLIKVIEKYNINPRQSIMLLWVVDRILVVSNCQGKLEILSQIEHKSITNAGLPDDFSNVLSQSQLNFSGVYHV